MKKLFIAASLIALSMPAYAREIQRFHESPRALGMGGAFTAVADDENALFYNAAGLGYVEDWGMAILNPLVEVNENGYDFYKDGKGVDFNSASEVADLLRDHMGEVVHIRAAMFPNFYMKHFAFGVLGRSQADIKPQNLAWPEVYAEVEYSYSAHGGIGWAFDIPHAGSLGVGASLKYIKSSWLDKNTDTEGQYATYTAVEISDEQFEEIIKDDLRDGSAFGADLGLIYKPQMLLDPTFALNVVNLIEPDFGSGRVNPRHFNFGAAINHDFKFVKLTGAFDFVDFTREVTGDEDHFKRVHMGIEAALPMILAVRAGLNQGYGSVGATIDLWAIKLDYAYYGEEIGTGSGDIVDKRHVAQLSLGW